MDTTSGSYPTTLRLVWVIGFFTIPIILLGQTHKTEVQIHAIHGLTPEEESLREFMESLPPLITAIINSDYFKYAILNSSIAFKQHYRQGQVENQDLLNYLLEAREDRLDEHCRSAGLESLDVIETKDRVIDIALEFIPAHEMETRNWSPVTAGFTPLGCPFIRLAKQHFNRYLENKDSVAASRTIIHEYMHTLYFTHETQEINRGDAPYAVEGIAKETARWLRFSMEQPEAFGRWKWMYSIKDGQLIKPNDPEDLYEIELTEIGQIRLIRNGKVIEDEIAKANYFSSDQGVYGFWNSLKNTDRNGIELVFDGNKLRTDYFPEAYGIYNFFEKKH